MSDLIRRSDASKLCINIVNEFLKSGEFVHLNEAMAIGERFKELPTADPNDEASRAYYEGWTNGEEAERSRHQPKRGEWIDYTCGSGCYCSNCGWDGDDIIDECIIQDFDFCPNCGARMKGADDE